MVYHPSLPFSLFLLLCLMFLLPDVYSKPSPSILLQIPFDLSSEFLFLPLLSHSTAFATIFFLVAAINFWMIVVDEPTTFRVIATIAFIIGGIMLLAAFKRARRSG